MIVRNNHYVPVWYQRGFLDGGDGELFVLDKSPTTSIALPNGTVKQVAPRVISRRGPLKFLRHHDLYTTTFLGQPNDEIERRLFGRIDNDGARSISVFQRWPVCDRMAIMKHLPREIGDPNKHLIKAIEYLDAQKIRTIKGLDNLRHIAKQTGLNLTQEQLMRLMQSQRQFLSTVLAEGFWEIVGADESDEKFVFSDDPVTLYNCDHYPATQMCQYPFDPHLFERGTRVIFPLDKNACLIVSHVEHSRAPSRTKAKRRRRNARAYDQTLITFLDIHRSRQLTPIEVATINYAIKRRAPRYIAAGSKDWLMPERLVGDPAWANVDKVLQHEGFAWKLATAETFVGYKDDSVFSTNEFGEHVYVPGWFARKNKKERDSA